MKKLTRWIASVTALLLFPLLVGGCARSPVSRQSVGDWFEPFDVPPVLTVYEKPQYPERAREQGLEGWVRVKVLVGSDGRVKSARVLRSSDPLFEPAALAAAREFHFTPAERDRRRVRATVLVPVWFRLDRVD